MSDQKNIPTTIDIRISAHVIDNGYRIATIAVEERGLFEAIAAFSKMLAPHIEDDRQVQIREITAWCSDCHRYHLDVQDVVAKFEHWFNTVTREAKHKVAEHVRRVFNEVEASTHAAKRCQKGSEKAN